MRFRTSVLLTALFVAVMPGGEMPLPPGPDSHPHGPRAHVGTIAPGELLQAQRAARRAYARRDRSGLTGAGQIVTYRAGDTHTGTGARGATVRLFSTGP